MSRRTEIQLNHARSSRERYRGFVQDYKHHRLDDLTDNGKPQEPLADSSKAKITSKDERRSKRREYLRDYARWLWPHRFAVGSLFVLALVAAGLEMIEPLFMRFIVDRVLLVKGMDVPSRLSRLNLAGIVFVTVVILSKLIATFKDYRQKLVNVRIM